ncbi:major facilitator superfamily domain-containing protein [Rutstroemia sp. NJR-2017a BVV2]|nr:major facilitator superfamily domain-containing protein [Rutstroemia sp. NJR-2017a BVV2]
MSKRLLNRRSDICSLCDFAGARQFPLGQPRLTPRAFDNPRTFTTSRKHATKPRRVHPLVQLEHSRRISSAPPPLQQEQNPRSQPSRHITEAELREELKHVTAASKSLFEQNAIPSDRATLEILQKCQLIAAEVAGEPAIPAQEKKESTAAASLLSSVDSAAKRVRLSKLSRESQRLVDDLSQLLYSIVSHPLIFITPKILEVYVSAQSSLGKPKTFPEVFHQYANKPLPVEGSSPVRYKAQNPNNVNNAIAQGVADQALQTAIDARELHVAMGIVDTSYALPAFRRAKFIRKGLVPSTGVILAPAAAYALASQVAMFQSTMETSMATNVAFAGILAYLGFTGTIGLVAITTANDQMDRVTWMPGMPLRERWIREEERAAIDKIAGSWGFQEKWRQGEEEGQDWELLREWIGNKGMLLDAVELMEGME